MRVLKHGHSGNDVKWLQHILGAEVDGKFGAKTKTALLNFQMRAGLAVDGLCGPKTQAALKLTDFRVWIWDPKKVEFIGARYEAKDKPLKTLEQWHNENPDAEWILNLAHFNLTGVGFDKYGTIRGRTLVYVRGRGYEIGYGGSGPVAWINEKNSCAGWKPGIIDGTKCKVSSVGKRARNANGIMNDGRYIHVQSVGKCTESALVSFIKNNYDVRHLLIQDGGGSVGAYHKKDGLFAPEMENAPHGRAVATVVALYK